VRPVLSPDGKLVLFTVTEATADGGKSHLWLAPAAGSDKARQVTFSPPADQRGERGAQWAPDGSAIYFLAKRGEHTQLFRLDMRGGEAAPYDLKIAPPVDESKEKNAIPPPGAAAASAADKSSDKKADEEACREEAGCRFGHAPDRRERLRAFSRWKVACGVGARPGDTRREEAEGREGRRQPGGPRDAWHAPLPGRAQADGSVDGALQAVAVAPDVHLAVWAPAADRLAVMTEGANEISDLGPAGAAGW